MTTCNRRIFITQIATTGTALACAGRAAAGPAIKRIEESEGKAASLGYKHDANNVDKARFPKFKAGEHCGKCTAWLGKPADAWAECDLMADRMVSNPGWCSSFVKAK